MIRFLAISIVTVLCFLACNTDVPQSGASAIASVFDQKLYEEDLPEFLSTGADSLASRSAYIEQWIRDALVLRQARKEISENSHIDEMVNDYRDNLYRAEYEKYLLDQRLDKRIRTEELQQYFDTNKQDYKLDHDLLKIVFIDLPSQHTQLSDVRKYWKANNWGKLDRMTRGDSINVYFGQKEWIGKDQLRTMLPKKVITSRSLKKDLKFESNLEGRRYFVKIWDFVDEDDDAPLEYLKTKISTVILHQRKEKLLRSIREELYEKELENNNIKVYSKKN